MDTHIHILIAMTLLTLILIILTMIITTLAIHTHTTPTPTTPMTTQATRMGITTITTELTLTAMTMHQPVTVPLTRHILSWIGSESSGPGFNQSSLDTEQIEYNTLLSNLRSTQFVA
jgi:hypothetical protein